jgi:hypothetical protein
VGASVPVMQTNDLTAALRYPCSEPNRRRAAAIAESADSPCA